jgi:hypothetical protein
MEDLAPASDGSQLEMQFSTDNGSTYITSTDHFVIRHNSFYTIDNFTVTFYTQGNAAGEEMIGDVWLRSRNDEGSLQILAEGRVKYQTTAAADRVVRSSCVTEAAGASDVDAVKFYYDIGNIASGTIRVFGR